ncbi:cysteine-rich venom protein pseudechetoxin [Pholidichthys leucotaenia]
MGRIIFLNTEICAETEAVQTEIVDQHNAFRRAVEPPASDMLLMSYNEDLAAAAQAWVDQCILAHGPPSSRMLDGYEVGENLFYSSYPYSWTFIVNAWHNEVSHYIYPKGSSNGEPIGHYTQVVWNSSYQVGCGVTFCTELNKYFYGCHYYRAGNFRAWPPYKTGEPCASCPNNCVDKLCTNPCPLINGYINCPELKDTYGCSHEVVNASCPASCQCPTEIIPIG